MGEKDEMQEWKEQALEVTTHREAVPYEAAGPSVKLCELVQAMELCPEYEGIAYDTRGAQVVVKEGTPVPWNGESARLWTDADDLEMRCALEEGKHVRVYYGSKNGEVMAKMPPATVVDAVRALANKRKFDPLQDMLNALPEWDGVKRGERWAVDLLGAEDSDYTRAACWLFCSGAIARAYSPGSKFDYMIVLKGPQGLGKSTVLRKMAMSDELFTDDIGDMNGRESKENLLGAWIVEDGELKSTLRANADIAKAFITRTQEKWRMAYARRATIAPRGFVLVGTTNRSQFLNDLTGNRRFVPIECGKVAPSVDVFGDGGKRYIEQLWAEMRTAYKEGKTWAYFPDWAQELAEQAQEESTVDNAQLDCVLNYIEAKEPGERVCVQELRECLDSIPGGANVKDQTIVMYMGHAPACWKYSQKKGYCKGYGSRRYWYREE